ncbi:PREDICTED: zinc finger RNA-binding protein-like [Priapulus caudatus]|uniref:Zinc finger RNA-binding protein-like n=1 Tax=Priapulus caudatus TaxID=37621 RepID=A0ABM1EEK9_PRICU|nr:PREDICTED: zinc finger RNA-binding protein-like [Priapulus caudatus]
MATNNYFGFTHAASAYGAQPTAAAYPAGTAAVAYATAPQAAYSATAAVAARPAYEAYQAAPGPAGGTFYTTAPRQDTAPLTTQAYRDTYAYTSQASAAVYGAPTAYVQPVAAAPAVVTYSSADTAYQQRARVAPAVMSQTDTYVYPSTTTFVASTTLPPTTTYSGYDAAVYSAATSLIQQQHVVKKTGVNTTWQYKKNFQNNKSKTGGKSGPPKSMQLHYCDVCKISCAGPQTYKEHLEGQKHKKKEAALKAGSATSATRGQKSLRCELCDVTCTGQDAYNAHIRGSKHQKVVKLHTRLGKPIPSAEPVMVKTSRSTTTLPSSLSPKNSTVVASVANKVTAVPKITFVGGAKLSTTVAKAAEVKTNSVVPVVPAVKADKVAAEPATLDKEADVIPVGEEYIEEVKNDEGKIISFTCKLCECRFNDPNAKEMHMKGRRHRLQYKKKVNPDLVVEIKPSLWQRRQQEKLQRQLQKEEFWRRRDAQMRFEERRRFEEMENRLWFRQPDAPGGLPRPAFIHPAPPRRPQSYDDRHVMAKHSMIYPNEQELQAVQSIVSASEKALKLVSDIITETEGPKLDDDKEVKKDDDVKADKTNNEQRQGAEKKERALKGVMRVGILAKGLLLHGSLRVELVLLCRDKPTRNLLDRIVEILPKQLAAVTEEKYEVKRCLADAGFTIVSTTDGLEACVVVTLTSQVMRDSSESTAVVAGAGGGEPVKQEHQDVLDRQKCLEALASLRHAKWFQARASGLQSCVIVIRIMYDLCQRVPAWSRLRTWAMELLCEKCVASGGPNQSPGDALRRIFEAIASGILLPGGPGLVDPCEKDPVDAAGSLTNQEREEITTSAQHALRLMAFRQISKLLGMDPLPTPRFPNKSANPRKRRRDGSESTPGDMGDGKKDKKDGGTEAMDTKG